MSLEAGEHVGAAAVTGETLGAERGRRTRCVPGGKAEVVGEKRKDEG